MRDDARVLLEQLARHLNCELEALTFLFESEFQAGNLDDVFDMPDSARERWVRACQRRQVLERRISAHEGPLETPHVYGSVAAE